MFLCHLHFTKKQKVYVSLPIYKQSRKINVLELEPVCRIQGDLLEEIEYIVHNYVSLSVLSPKTERCVLLA